MTADVLSRVFAALADPTRRDMVARLAAGDATVKQLAERYPMTLQAVYKHLKGLEDGGGGSRPGGPPPRPVALGAGGLGPVGKVVRGLPAPARERSRPP